MIDTYSIFDIVEAYAATNSTVRVVDKNNTALIEISNAPNRDNYAIINIHPLENGVQDRVELLNDVTLVFKKDNLLINKITASIASSSTMFGRFIKNNLVLLDWILDDCEVTQKAKKYLLTKQNTNTKQ